MPLLQESLLNDKGKPRKGLPYPASGCVTDLDP